jgi:chemotaxis protein MotB
MRGRQSQTFRESFNVWPGFTDVMVGLLLVFVFVVTLFTITQTILSRSILKKDTELERLQRELSTKSSELEKLGAEISKLEKLFQSETEKSGSLEQALALKVHDLETALAQLTTRDLDIEEKTKEITRQKADLESALEALKESAIEVVEKNRALSREKAEVGAALSKLEQSSSMLEEKEKRISELGLNLQETESALAKTRSETAEKTASLAELKARLDRLNARIADLNQKIAAYVAEIDKLNKLLAESKVEESSEKTKAATLQKEVTSLRSRLDEISAKLAKPKDEEKKDFKLSQLVELLGQKEQEIDRLRKLSKYRSEFLAKLQEVFSGLTDIRIQGDRFVFQSEILFASGKTEINESGKQELDKFVKIYKEMVPKIPPGLDLIIMVQGHTDTDPVKSARFQSNWELSAARAMQVVRYLIEKGIPASRVGASALSEFHPVEKGASVEAKRFNRRIEIKITTL